MGLLIAAAACSSNTESEEPSPGCSPGNVGCDAGVGITAGGSGAPSGSTGGLSGGAGRGQGGSFGGAASSAGGAAAAAGGSPSGGLTSAGGVGPDAAAPNDASSGNGGGGTSNTAGAVGSGGTRTGGTPGTGGKTSTGGTSGSGGATGGSGGTVGSGGTNGTGGQGNVPPYTPVYRVPVRLHVGQSNLTNPEITAALAEVNRIWLTQAGVCFEFEVTDSETNRTGGLDIRYLSGPIPGNPTANGVTQSAHAIYVIDHPTLYSAPNPTSNFTGRTTAHEIGHALGLSHENPPDDPTYNDCANPCICVVNNLVCDDFLMRSHRQGFFLAAPEIAISRPNAKSKALADQTPLSCSAPVFN